LQIDSDVLQHSTACMISSFLLVDPEQTSDHFSCRVSRGLTHMRSQAS
jgi:hypothetical protein